MRRARAEKTGIVTIVGPTGVGKTSVAVLIAERLGGEIVSADARQVYRGMDIGTTKPMPEERRRARHHLIDVIDPSETYDAARFAADAEKAIADIIERGAEPIVAGGTGFYIASLFEGFFDGPERDDEIRAKLSTRAREEGTRTLHTELARIDPEMAARLHPNDTARVVRALEVYESSGKTLSEWQASGRRRPAYLANYFGLVRPRTELYARIDSRVDSMMKKGLLGEIRRLKEEGKLERSMPAASAVGYRELLAFIDGEYETQKEATEAIKRSTRHYAKRQLTWFSGIDDVDWIDVSSLGSEGAADEIVERWTEAKREFGE